MDKYYQLLDANSANVSPLWKVTHVTSMLFATISGFVSAYTLGKAIEAFNENCILFAHIIFLDNSTITDENRKLPDYYHEIDMPATDWGKTTECYFCQFTPVMSMISGLIWGAFFIVCSKGGAGYISDAIYRPWRIVYPAIVFTIIAIGLLALSTVQLSSGIDIFCAQFKDIFNTTKCTNQIDEYTLLFNDTEKPMIIFLQVSYIASIICIICWISQLITLILRIVCIADFEMFRITVTFPNDSEEILQTVVEPDNASYLEDNISYLSKVSINKIPSKSKHRFFHKFSPFTLAKKISQFKRSSSDQYDTDEDDNISLSESIFSGKVFVDNRSIMETKSSYSLDLITNTSSDVKVDIEKYNVQDDFVDDIVFSSLFFAKKEKLVTKIVDVHPKISLPFVPHNTESFMSNVLYSNQNFDNTNISPNEVKISNSESSEFQENLLITSAQINNITESEKNISNNQINNETDDENIGNSSSTLKIDASSFFTDKISVKSLQFVQQSPSLSNDILQFQLLKLNSDDDLKIKIEESEEFNNSTINLIDLYEHSNSVSMQLIDYEQLPHADNENIDEVIMNIIDIISEESIINPYNQIETISNNENISNLSQDTVNLIPVNEEFQIPKSFSSLAKSSSHQNMSMLSKLTEQSKEVVQITNNETIDLNNYIRDSSAILSLAINNHRKDSYEETPPPEFREEHRDEVNQTESNQIRETILRVYMALWLTVVLSNFGLL